jgi:SecD/SecF fusion protein
MMQLLSATQIDFIGKRHAAAVLSLVLITVGIVAIVARGVDIFDIDFRGGTSVHLMLDEAAETEDVRAIVDRKFKELDVQYTLTGMREAPGQTSLQIYKVDSAIEEVRDLEAAVQDAFRSDGGAIKLATYSLESGTPKTVRVASPPPDSTSSSAETEDASAGDDEPPAEEPSPSADQKPQPSDDEPETRQNEDPTAGSSEEVTDPNSSGAAVPSRSSMLIAMADEVRYVLAQEDGGEQTAPSDQAAAEAPPAAEPDSPAEVANSEEIDELAGSATAAETEKATTEQADQAPPAEAITDYYLEVPLRFGYGINEETLTAEIEGAAQELDIPLGYFELNTADPDWQPGNSNAYTEWTLRIAAGEQQTKQLLDHLSQKFADTPVWPSSSKIGSAVAGRMKNKATMALLTSLLGIIVYIWIRFQRVMFGLAAVVALVHDVLITLGAIAVSAWLAGIFGFLLIEEFKISLPIVAALLTIIGYSLNDTIVVFDRIREVRGKSPQLTGEMVNRSINQTLNRTLLTSLTTLLVVAVLYAIGGEGIHGFAFALVVGVIVGTYSSIFVASPVLLWMAGGQQRREKKPAAA